jgi:hypothetical protein
MTTMTAPIKYQRVADTAKLVRAAVKAAFPGVKFSVRSESYAGGASINVFWEDGPTPSDVEKVIGVYAGARFDGMIDLKYHVQHRLCPVHGVQLARVYGHGAGLDRDDEEGPCCEQAEPIHFGADYVFGHRSYSPEFRAVLEAMVAEQEGVETYDPQRRINDAWMSDSFHRLAQKTAR